ncbi:MAG: sodium:proton antiporter [Sulfolobales archaeon]|nr:sodium:proton antiporter [Sulfolobales archaeon]MCX8186434.1 sodium:proton antiporter [Sulfolobales archaeon]MDW7969764.1 sodium:proton antiporter [Sulfolobales archaeon]
MSTDLDLFLANVSLISLLAIIGISLYGILARPNIIKKIIALTIFTDAANLLAILVGFRRPPSAPPVLLNLQPSPSEIAEFSSTAVDPLPQALVLTAVVIGMAVNMLIIFIALQLYRLYGTLDVRKVRRLRG